MNKPFKGVQGKKLRDSMIPVVTGQRVKVHYGKGSRFGEVIGIREDHRILLSERSDFAGLTTGEFHHFRDANEVVFVQDQDEPSSVNPGVVLSRPQCSLPTNDPELEKVLERIRRNKRAEQDRITDRCIRRAERKRNRIISAMDRALEKARLFAIQLDEITQKIEELKKSKHHG